jgi:hypothetical protein
MAKSDLTAARVRELVSYDPDTGEFRWNVDRGGRRSGSVPGWVSHWGYAEFKINRSQYKAHRLAWLYVTGEWPKGEIDHINGVRTDNRFVNLRDVDRTTNAENVRRARCDSTTGLQGVAPSSDGKWWRARIRSGKLRMSLGTFRTPEAAHAAYVEAKRKIHAGCTL